MFQILHKKYAFGNKFLSSVSLHNKKWTTEKTLVHYLSYIQVSLKILQVTLTVETLHVTKVNQILLICAFQYKNDVLECLNPENLFIIVAYVNLFDFL